METDIMTAYGLSQRFISLASEYEELSAARIISQEKGLYRVVSEFGEKFAEVSGKFRHNAITVSDFPAVGDFVMLDWNDTGNAIIHSVLQRKSCFVRKAAGEAHQEQVVAANIDIVFLCMSLNNDFNLRRLERYVSIAWDSGARPVVVLTKADLCENTDEVLAKVSEVAIGVDILVTSAVSDNGYKEIIPFVTEGTTIAFIGSSGVGKSTLINCLMGNEKMATNSLRNDDKGRHTTTHRELLLLPTGGLVIDTPGMRELGMWDVFSGIEHTFSEIEGLLTQCRFRNCTHSGEVGCAIEAALKTGEISQERWNAYKKLKAENAYAQDSESYLEAKERKFKDIARFNKTNKKR